MVNFEAIIVAWLKADEAITAPVAGRVPSQVDEPFVRVQLVNAQSDPRSPARHLASAFVQLDCYGAADENEAQATAFATAEACHARIHAMKGVQGAAVVTAVTGLAVRRVPDADFSPTRERYIVEAQVTAHPRSVAS